MPADLPQLLTTLKTEIELVEAFLDVLRQEAKVLEDGAAESALAESTARKNELADSLMHAAERRNVLLSNMGFPADAPGLAAAIEAHPELTPFRDTLLKVTEQARHHNESNGRVIEMFLEHNQRALETLRRVAGPGEIYDASGRTRPGGRGGSRNIKAG